MKKFWKKGAKALGLLASAFLLFGAVSCGGDDDGGEEEKQEQKQETTSAVTGISVSPKEATLYIDTSDSNAAKKEIELTAEIVTTGDADKTVLWSTEGDFVILSATEGEKITVTAVKSGTTTVTATAKGDTTKTASATITVYANTYTESVLAGITGNYVGSNAVVIKKDGTVTVDGTAGTETATVTKDGENYVVTATIGSDTYTFTVVKSKNDEYSISSAKKGEETLTIEKAVTLDGTKKFATIKEALAAITDDGAHTIKLAKGTYEENGLSYNGSASITIEGDTTTKYGADVVIKGKGSSQKNSTDRCLLYVGGKANLTLKNVTLQNTIKRDEVTDKDSDGNKLTQAEALGFNSTGKLIAYNSSFKSHQDTLRTVGKAWFYKCYVEGDVDFIWMEQSGVVALYEECEIVCVNDDGANGAYVLAPRVTVGNKIAKGNVIYKSTIKISEGSTFSQGAYLFRNPWGSNTKYYNQGAIVDTTLTGTFTADLAKSAAMGTADQQFIGWKVDKTIGDAYANKLLSIGVLSDRYEKREYNGRYVILNRVYNTTTQKFETVAESELWDPASELTASGLNAGDTITADSSKDNIFLDYADASKTTIGDELSVTNFSGAVSSGVTWSLEAFTENTYTTKISDNSVSINESTGVITNTNAGNVYAKVTAKVGEKSDTLVVYKVGATGFSIDETATVAAGSKKQLSVTFVPVEASAAVTWESSDQTVATVDENGVVTGVKTGTATITAKVSGLPDQTCSVTVTAPAVLKKFGTSVSGADTAAYTSFGLNEILLYTTQAIDPTKDTASIEAKIVYAADSKVGVGFASFDEGLYSDATPAGQVYITTQGARYKTGSNASWNGAGTTPTAPKAAGTFIGKAWTKADGKLYFSLTTEDGKTAYSRDGTGTSTYVGNSSPLYFALGGENNAGNGSVSISDIKIVYGDVEYIVGSLEDISGTVPFTASRA